MGLRGPAGDNTHLRVLKGKDAPEVLAKEPKPSPARRVVRPPGMSDKGRTVWNRLAPDLIKQKLLDPWCVDEFEQFCEAVVIARTARQLITRDGILVGGEKHDAVKNPAIQVWRDSTLLIHQLGNRFCLKPVDRRALAPEVPADGDPAQDFFTA